MGCWNWLALDAYWLLGVLAILWHWHILRIHVLALVAQVRVVESMLHRLRLFIRWSALGSSILGHVWSTLWLRMLIPV